jgi:OOP family OmpA-OmpF porin
MKKKVIFISCALLAAQSFAENKFSAELSLGSADQNSTFVDGDSSPDETTTDSSTSYGLRGLYHVHPNFAVELGFSDYGEINRSYIDSFGDRISESISSDAINAGVRGIWPINEIFSINGRLGYAFWNYEASATDSSMPDMTFKLDDSGNDLYYGVGAEYKINENFRIGAEYIITDMGASFTSISGVSIPKVEIDHEVENLALTLGYTF